MNATVLNALADPFGGAPSAEGAVRTQQGDNGPGSSPVATATGSRVGFLGDLQRLYHPSSPMTWFGIAAVATFTLIAVSHGHLGGEAAAHVGPVHAAAGVGGGGD